MITEAQTGSHWKSCRVHYWIPKVSQTYRMSWRCIYWLNWNRTGWWVRGEFDKQVRPETIFIATNVIIGIDKRCYLESCLRNKNHPDHKTSTATLTKINSKSHELLSANYTSGRHTITIITVTLFNIQR